MVNKGGFCQSLMVVQQWRRHRKRGKRNGSNYSSGRGQSLLCGVSSRGVDCVADSVADCVLASKEKKKRRAVSATCKSL